MTNQISRITSKINEYKAELDQELAKEEKNDIQIHVLRLRIKVFEDRKKQMLNIAVTEKEMFEKSRKRKRGRAKKIITVNSK